jgi:hypothetical protein
LQLQKLGATLSDQKALRQKLFNAFELSFYIWDCQLLFIALKWCNFRRYAPFCNYVAQDMNELHGMSRPTGDEPPPFATRPDSSKDVVYSLRRTRRALLDFLGKPNLKAIRHEYID